MAERGKTLVALGVVVTLLIGIMIGNAATYNVLSSEDEDTNYCVPYQTCKEFNSSSVMEMYRRCILRPGNQGPRSPAQREGGECRDLILKEHLCEGKGVFIPYCNQQTCEEEYPGREVLVDTYRETTCTVRAVNNNETVVRWWQFAVLFLLMEIVFFMPMHAFENAWWHRTVNRENLFYFFSVLCVYVIALLTPSSPFCAPFYCSFSGTRDGRGEWWWAIIVVCSLVVAWIVPAEIICATVSVPKVPRLEYLDRANHNPNNLDARCLASTINRDVELLYKTREGGWQFVRPFHKFWEFVTRRKATNYEYIQERLRRISDEELNYILTKINVPMLFRLVPEKHPLITMFCMGASDTQSVLGRTLTN